MKIFISIILLLGPCIAISQNWDWVNYTYGNGANHAYYDLEVTNDNNYILGVGRYRSTATFYGQDTNVVSPLYLGSRDVFLTKVDTNGNYEWVVTDGGAGNDFAEGVAIDEFDNIYVVGTTSDSSYYGNIGLLSGPSGTGSVLIAKYDGDGNALWAKSFNGEGWDFAKEAECDKNGNLFVAGYQSGNFEYAPGDTLFDRGYFVMKLDYAGNVIWCKGPSNQSASGYTVVNSLELHNNELYVGGRVKTAVTFDTIAISGPSWDDMFFAKMDTAGSFEWVRTGGGIYYTDCQDLVIKDDKIYVAGSYSGTATFGGITVTSATIGSGGQAEFNSRDAFVAKYNIDGTVCEWLKDEKSLLLDVHYNILIDKNNDVVVTGAYAEDNIYSSSISEGDLRIIAYDTSGIFQWELFPTGVNKGEGIIMKESQHGDYYFGGRIKGSYNFNASNIVPAPISKFASVIAKIYPPIEIEATEYTACTNDSLILAVQDRFGQPLNYTWFNNGIAIHNTDSIKLSVNNLDTVYCVISNGYEIDTAYYYLNENNLPFIDLGDDTSICTNSPSLVLAVDTNFVNYTWNNSTMDSTAQLIVQQSGLFWIDVIDTNSCGNTDTIAITFNGLPAVDLGQEIVVCEDQDSVQIGIMNLASIASYSWLPNLISDTTSMIYVNATDTYILSVLDTNNCQNSDTINVNFLPLPTLQVGTDTSICENNAPITISVPNIYNNYQWSTAMNDTLNYSTISTPGTYYLTVYNSDGCSQIDSIAINFFDDPQFNLGNDTVTCDYNLTIVLSGPTGFSNYQWSTGINDTTITTNINQTGTYYLTITDQNSCENTDSIDVSFLDCTNINESVESQIQISIANNSALINSIDQEFTVTIFDLSGKLIQKHQSPTFIDLQQFSTGLYFLHYSGSIETTSKFIKR